MARSVCTRGSKCMRNFPVSDRKRGQVIVFIITCFSGQGHVSLMYFEEACNARETVPA